MFLFFVYKQNIGILNSAIACKMNFITDEEIINMVNAVLPKVSVEDSEKMNMSCLNTISELSIDLRTRSFELEAADLDYDTIEIQQLNIDPDIPLKAVATDLVVKEFFKTEDTFFEFLLLTCTSFERVLEIYRSRKKLTINQLFFLYKGGNLLRFVSKDFTLEFPAHVTKKLNQFYNPFFKRSDADFSIYIHPNLDQYDDIYYECSLLAYLVQDKLREIFTKNLETYFDLFRYHKKYQHKILVPYLELFNKASGFEDNFYDFKIGEVTAIGDIYYPYYPNSDVTLRFIKPNEDWLLETREAIIGEIKVPNSIMTITHNNALDFSGGDSTNRQKFNLTRTKLIFTLLQKDGITRNIGGELTDVSIPHRLSSRDLIGFFNHLKEETVRYTMHLSMDNNTVRTLNCVGFSLAYLTNDLEDILFKQNYYPWIDSKYVKRLNRSMYMYFIDIFINIKNTSCRIELLTTLESLIFRPLITVEFGNINKLINHIECFFENLSDKINIYQFIWYLIKLLKKIKENDLVEMESLHQFGEHLVKNIGFLIETVNNIKFYCDTDGDIKLDYLYETKMSDFI